jgi:hypothetical protein
MQSGISDIILSYKEASFGAGVSGATQKTFGYTQLFEVNIDTNTTQWRSLENDSALPAGNVDGVFSVAGRHEWYPTDGREFEAFLGSLTDGGAGSFTLAHTKTLPSWAHKVFLNASEWGVVDGVKYGNTTITIARGDTPVLVSSQWFGRHVTDGSTFTAVPPTRNPFIYLDASFTKGGSAYADIENLVFEVQRVLSPRRLIRSTSAGSKRLITEIVEGSANILVSGTLSARKDVIDELRGGTSLVDVRTDKNLVVTLGNSTNTLVLTITGGRFTTGKRVLEKTQEIAMMDFAGVGLTIAGSGTY